MWQKGLKALGIFTIGLTLVSCNLDSLKDPIVVAEVNDEFHIDLWEELSPSGDELLFLIQSIEEFDCENYGIDYSMIKRGRQFEISLKEIQEPADCEEGVNTAHVNINLGLLTPGYYELDIDLRNTVVNTGQLTVTGESYVIEMEDPKGISFLRRELFRVPAKTIWGYIAYEDGSEAIANDFVSQLNEMTTPKSLKKGYYGYFSIQTDNSDQILLGSPPEGPFQSFLFEFDGQESMLSELVDQYRDDFGSAIEISLINQDGKSF